MHWGVYLVPEMGEWYARNMYKQGNSAYKFHVANFGHPSKVGYKEIVPMWKAEKVAVHGLELIVR